ncbi:MAG: hypothetical protein A2626_02920 [Candidatus Nealsonbacteria bacterium RIFCSPHIGHO2_01_FULL_38_55]|uniref:Uncharacterized protein n=2 Tax=Candidatus Nealsoniibacteriota TaxID=1817911 RepID=A0A1G2EKQ7_9BACT|nr:MAG: hypothetical protein A2626_02920 [Candidatus Nealsonbacteria bacterium RIFCSPHIGHO2_01_FULL_38_55]OGZ23608.1 MAG: hypothetical protein A2981_00100 [Candidatus Nealsonbacteria bacterium RIFCSPLOWO2_01_FULL_38_120]OGZ26384.1 MAG: hypothetical protein A2W71_02125 [Candidatus Nealsonbacteria bacterium RIFCSPLOWO2_02_39_8]
MTLNSGFSIVGEWAKSASSNFLISKSGSVGEIFNGKNSTVFVGKSKLPIFIGSFFILVKIYHQLKTTIVVFN